MGSEMCIRDRIIDSATEHLDDAVCQPPPHQEQPLDVIPVRGFNTNVASRIEVSGSSPCLRLRRRQMDETQFSRGSSSFWGRKGFPYRHSSEKGFPVQLKRGPTVRKEDGARVPRNGGTRHSDDGSHRSEIGPLSLGEGVPVRRKWGYRSLLYGGTKAPREMGTRPSVKRCPFVGNGLHVFRRRVSRPRKRASPPSQEGSPSSGRGTRSWDKGHPRPSGKGFSSLGRRVPALGKGVCASQG